MGTTIEELEQWMQAPTESEGLEFKAARSGYDGGKLLDYCVAIANEGRGKFILGVTVTVEIYTDRLEVSNPGRPIIPPDRFADEYQSRNERLAGPMRRLGMCEEQGLGVDRVIASTEVYGLPAPDFRLGERHTMAILYAQKSFEEMDRRERTRACYWHCVLRYVTGQKMTNASLRDRFGLPEGRSETVSRVIAETLHEGRIKSDDPTRTSKSTRAIFRTGRDSYLVAGRTASLKPLDATLLI